MLVIPLAEWLYEDGIGENRALLIDGGIVRAIRIERKIAFHTCKYGLITSAKLLKKHGKGGFALLDDGTEVVLRNWPQNYSEGQTIIAEVVREPLLERTRQKPAIIRAAPDGEIQPAPSLLDNIIASQTVYRKCANHDDDTLAKAGWYEVLEQAENGVVPFAGGKLIVDEAAAMTMIDVDGDEDNVSLAKKAAVAAAQGIQSFDIQGGVGIDFPTIESKSDRQNIAAIFDESMAIPCERTSINGFGFMQVMMKQTNPSVIAILSENKHLSAALTLFRRAEYEGTKMEISSAHMQILAHSKIISIMKKYDWLEDLKSRTARSWELIEDDDIPDALISRCPVV